MSFSFNNFLGNVSGAEQILEAIQDVSDKALFIDGTKSMAGTLSLSNNLLIGPSAVELNEQASGILPAAGHLSVYAKTDSNLYIQDDLGTETNITTDSVTSIKSDIPLTTNNTLLVTDTGGATTRSVRETGIKVSANDGLSLINGLSTSGSGNQIFLHSNLSSSDAISILTNDAASGIRINSELSSISAVSIAATNSSGGVTIESEAGGNRIISGGVILCESSAIGTSSIRLLTTNATSGISLETGSNGVRIINGALWIGDSGSAFFQKIFTPLLTSDISWILPDSLGSSGDVLSDIDGAGTLGWLSGVTTTSSGPYVVGNVAVFENISGTILDDRDVNISLTNDITGVATIDIVHTATESDDHALEIDVGASGFSDIKGIDIVYSTGAITSVDDEEAILVNVDQSFSVGGRVVGLEIIGTDQGAAEIDGMECGAGVHPILQQSGIFADADVLLNIAANVTVALSSGGAGDISIFSNDNDTFTIQSSAKFSEIEFILDVFSSGSGVAPMFEYSNGSSPTTWATFGPLDGTNGFRNNGVVIWEIIDIPGWVVGDSTNFEIRITRTRNTLSTTPRCDLVQISATLIYEWDNNGDVFIRYIGSDQFDTDAVGLGFYGTSPVAKPEITGERHDNPALADLLSSLDTQGLITDSTTVGENELPTNYIDGLIISDDLSNSKFINSGSCRSDDDSTNLVLGSQTDVDISISGAGGLDTGSEASNTFYSVWIIGIGDASISTLLSTSSTSPTLPGSYTKKRRIGWVRNNGSSDFYDYSTTHTGRDKMYLWNESETVLELLTNGAATTWTNVDISELVPPTCTLAYINTNHVSSDSGQDYASFRQAGLGGGTSVVTNPYAHRCFGSSASGGVTSASTCFWIRTDITQNIEYGNSSGSEETDIWVLGYMDSL